VTTGRSQMLSRGDIRDWDAVVDQVLVSAAATQDASGYHQ